MDNIKMLDEKDIPDDLTVLREQIAIRRKLIGQMVGSLYPGILANQIDRISKRLDKYLVMEAKTKVVIET